MMLETECLFLRQINQGNYAAEAVKACKSYVFKRLKAKEMFSIISGTNAASKKAALRNGMSGVDTSRRSYRGNDMSCCLYWVKMRILETRFCQMGKAAVAALRILVYNYYEYFWFLS